MSSAKHSFQFLLEQYRKEHDLENDVLKCVLMGTGFTFDPSAHSTYGDVSASEIATGNGYTQGGKVVEAVSASIDSVNDRVLVVGNNVQWLADGGPLPTCAAAIIFNDTHVNDTIVVGVQFAEEETVEDGAYIRVTIENGICAAYLEAPSP